MNTNQDKKFDIDLKEATEFFNDFFLKLYKSILFKELVCLTESYLTDI